jgi:hypothetical protein
MELEGNGTRFLASRHACFYKANCPEIPTLFGLSIPTRENIPLSPSGKSVI